MEPTTPGPGTRRWLIAMGLLAIAVGRIVANSVQLSETYDEGVHIAAGIELLDRGSFTWEPKHPPLGRVAVALGPWLSGIGFQGMPDMWSEGRAIIHAGDAERTLFLARLGVLPFFLLAGLILWRWTRRLAGEVEALGAVALYSLTPIILAHAGIATTDMAMSATFVALLYAASRWLEAPTPVTSAWLGLAGAAAVTAKLSSVPFFGVAVVLVLVVRAWQARVGGDRPMLLTRSHGRGLPVVALVALLSAWALYRFQVGWWHGVPVPLTSLGQGLRDLVTHNAYGHASWLRGEAYADGRLLFFPVGIAVKAPLTLLALGVAGLGLLLRRAIVTHAWQPAVPVLACVAVLAVSIPARINIGTRHVLPVFLLLALGGGIALAAAWRRAPRGIPRVVVATLMAAGMLSTVWPRRDPLAWFNELAGANPERLLVDSDLDWGQDLLRLRDTLATRGIDSVTMAYFGSAVPEMYGLPVRARWKRGMPVQGWFAVSRTLRARGDASLRNGVWELHPEALRWLDAYTPAASIGSGMVLYHLDGPRATP